MSTLTTAGEVTGRKVISRASAEDLGDVRHVVVDAPARRVSALAVGSRRHVRLVPWDAVRIGPDAVVIENEAALREPVEDADKAAASGKASLLGQRLLDDQGFERGKVTDVTFDADTGAVETIVTADGAVAAERLRGAGSYAVVVAADHADAPADAATHQ